MTDQPRSLNRIGIVSTRICGTDGVSLEIGKWATILERLGYECYYICGKSDRPADRTAVIEAADFQNPEIRALQRDLFSRRTRTRQASLELHRLKREILEQFDAAIERFQLDLLIAENAVTIPINIPLGAAIVEFLLENAMPCIAHHHDFVWERQRYLVNAVDDYLRAFFPPPLRAMEHVVINSVAGEEFSRRTGLSAHVIPNVMDFDHSPDEPDEFSRDFRETIGVGEDDFLILQPTRVVARKGIEHTIELVRRLDDPRCRLVISHTTNDEGPAYRRRIETFAEMMGVELIFADRWISDTRGKAEDGGKRYSIWDVYPHADLVAYPSTYEGFGNAFLEAVYYRKPLLCNRYSIFQTDIEPYGFQVVEMDGFLTDEVVSEVRELLSDPSRAGTMAEHNYAVAKEHFSYRRVERELERMLTRPELCVPRCDGTGVRPELR